ncbi:hypothetical protein JCM11641_005033 [Rhodosporidiobolus odoratus]
MPSAIPSRDVVSPPTPPLSPTLKNIFRRSRSRPQLSPVTIPTASPDPQNNYDCRPKSPSVVLSPASPDFPTIGLPPLPPPTPTELVAAQLLPLARPVEEVEASPRRNNGKAPMDPTLRHSLALLDERLAEIEQLGFGGAVSDAPQSRRGSWLEGNVLMEENEEESPRRERNEAQAGPAKAPLATLGAKDVSLSSLSSFASGTSSEDAFDIADFPSIDQFMNPRSFDLDLPVHPPADRKRSSDLMAFPVPPSLPAIPSRNPSTLSLGVDTAEDQVFEQLAELGETRDMQGLGLFSSTETNVESASPSPILSRSRSSSASSRSSLSSKSFGASTLASTAANTSFGQRDKEEPFPPELNSTLPLFASAAYSPYRSTRSTRPAPLSAAAIASTSTCPALASPFVEGGSFAATLSRSRANSLAPISPEEHSFPLPSPTNSHFSVRSSSLRQRVEGSPASASPTSSGRASPSLGNEGYFARSDLLGELDMGGIPTWYAAPTPAAILEADEDQQEELADPQPEQGRHDHIRVIEAVPPPGPGAYGQRPTLPASPSSTFGTIRRISSFGILKKCKSDAVLQQSAKENQSPSSMSSPRFGLVKRKSEAALSTLLKSSKSSSTLDSKENSTAVTDSPAQPTPKQSGMKRQSISSPKLNSLFRSPTSPTRRPSGPASPSSLSPQAFSAHPRTLSFGKAGEATSKVKKRLSMYFGEQPAPGKKDGNGEIIPPLPPTPKEHLPARTRTPIVIDVAKANGLEASAKRNRSEQSPALTLDITGTPSTAQGSLLFSSETSPAESIFPNTPISPSAGSVYEKALPSPFQDALSPTDSGFPSAGPTSPTAADHPVSLASFLKATDPDQQLIVKRPARTSSFFQPSSVFPPTKSSSGRDRSQSRSSSRPTSPLEDSKWSRPTSPALLEALKSAVATSPLSIGPGLDKQVFFPPQQIQAFPVQVPTINPLRPVPAIVDDDEESSGEDDYGEGTDESDEDDKPLGVVVPGALTAQKSLRVTAAKKRRSERKEQEKKGKMASTVKSRSGAVEDPFELEKTAAMVATPPTSTDGRDSVGSATRSIKSPLSTMPSVGTYPSCSTITSLQFAGHDTLLPQNDASIDRRAFATTGMKRSPSSPLDPKVADSALTMDSPVMTQESLPAQPSSLQHSLSTGGGRSRAKSVSRTGSSPPQNAPPMPSMRPPPVPPTSDPAPLARRPSLHPDVPQASLVRRPSLQPDAPQPPLAHRPSLNPKSSTSPPISAANVTPQVARRPSLHPDSQPTGMSRKASASSAKSTTVDSSNGHALARRPTLGSRARSGTVSSPPPVEQRVYLDVTCSQHLTVSISDKTLAGEIVVFAKGKGALGKPGSPKEALEGGWALYEVWRSMGIERPIREYELVADVVKSWDNESNVLLFKRTQLWPVLSSHARLHPTMPKTGPVQFEVKKGKWSKRFLEMKEGAVSYSKSEKGKDATILCQLSNFDVYFVSTQTAEQLKAPKPFVFALKSRLTRAHFEEKSEWCHFLSVKTADEMQSWVKVILEAGNVAARQREQAVLGSATSPSAINSPILSGPLIPSTAFASPDEVPPVPSLPPVTTVMTPAAAIAAAARSSSRPAPAILSPRSQTLPLGATSANAPPASSLARNKTVSKPTTREWGAMGREEKHGFVKDSEKAMKQAKQPLLDLTR